MKSSAITFFEQLNIKEELIYIFKHGLVLYEYQFIPYLNENDYLL